jgi:hypothetical protein
VQKDEPSLTIVDEVGRRPDCRRCGESTSRELSWDGKAGVIADEFPMWRQVTVQTFKQARVSFLALARFGS